MNKYILISLTILLFSCGGNGDGQSSSDGSGYCDCLYIPNETDKKRVVEKYDYDGNLKYKLYWDENTNQVVEEEWSRDSKYKRTWKCHQQVINDEQTGYHKGLGGEYLQEEKSWYKGVLTDHVTYDECGYEIKRLGFNNKGTITYESENYGIEDIYSYYQRVYTGHHYDTEDKYEYNYNILYDSNGNLKDSIENLYPKIFPNKFTPTNNIMIESRFGKGQKFERNYYNDGQLRWEKIYLLGHIISTNEYYENGNIQYEGRYDLFREEENGDNLTSGGNDVIKKYSKNGIILESNYIKNHNTIGTYFGKGFDHSGYGYQWSDQLNNHGDYYEGSLVQLKTEFDVEYSDWDGIVKIYCSDWDGDNDIPRKEPITEVKFINGNPHGEFIFYTCDDENEKLEYKYDNGKLLSFKRWYNGVVTINEVY